MAAYQHENGPALDLGFEHRFESVTGEQAQLISAQLKFEYDYAYWARGPTRIGLRSMLRRLGRYTVICSLAKYAPQEDVKKGSV